MYYWTFTYTYSTGNVIFHQSDTYVASNFTGAMEAFMETIRLRFPPGIEVCNVDIDKGNRARTL